MAELPKR